MKKLIILLVALFMFMSVSVLTFAGDSKEKEITNQGRYEVVNPNHTQVLGGKSKNASNGLEKAAERSKSVSESKSGSEPKSGSK